MISYNALSANIKIGWSARLSSDLNLSLWNSLDLLDGGEFESYADNSSRNLFLLKKMASQT